MSRLFFPNEHVKLEKLPAEQGRLSFYGMLQNLIWNEEVVANPDLPSPSAHE